MFYAKSLIFIPQNIHFHSLDKPIKFVTFLSQHEQVNILHSCIRRAAYLQAESRQDELLNPHINGNRVPALYAAILKNPPIWQGGGKSQP